MRDNDEILYSECWTEEDERQYQRERQEELHLFLKSELEQAKQLSAKHRKKDKIYLITLGAFLITFAILLFVIIALAIGNIAASILICTILIMAGVCCVINGILIR